MNAFTAGSIPPGIWNLNKLQYLYLYLNNLSGSIVINGTLGATSLVELDLSANQLSGIIPESFGSLMNLRLLYLFSNNFSGEIPTSIAQLRSQKTLKLFDNKLTGVLPAELGKHSPLLRDIEVDGNDLSGPIPAGLCDNGQLWLFSAYNNRLNGSIPASLASCVTLAGLLLANNDLSGEIPAVSLATGMPLLLMLNLSRNHLSGGIPPSITNIKSLIVLDLSMNQLTGNIPMGLATGMRPLQEMDLSVNHLSGGIPATISTYQSLTTLNLSKNQLTGEIPAELGSNIVLYRLDLSSNHLSGGIPLALKRSMLGELNLSSNQLTGKVPPNLAVPANSNSFVDNPGLCSIAPASGYLVGVSSCTARRSSGGISRGLRAALLAGGSMVLFVVAAITACILLGMKKPGLVQQETWKLTPFQALDFTEDIVLRGLTEENIIGKGGSGRVYRVVYTNDNNIGATLAVKRIGVGRQDRMLERQFESEANILSRIRHTNIVRLLCCISGTGSNLLVYEYTGNGSLNRWLHSHIVPAGSMTTNTQSVRRALLDWPTRVRIAVGAARGLCYMHHECSPPIVHRDVKSSNILLDSELQAKVADFGLARVLVRAGTLNSVSVVAGSFGYMAPEYAYTRKVDEKVDVYSFGVVLLELVTGKKANEGDEHSSLAEWAWRHLQSGKIIADATDECIRETRHSNEIEIVFKLGVICTGDVASSRPTMKDVLQVLFKCQHPADAALGEGERCRVR